MGQCKSMDDQIRRSGGESHTILVFRYVQGEPKIYVSFYFRTSKPFFLFCKINRSVSSAPTCSIHSPSFRLFLGYRPAFLSAWSRMYCSCPFVLRNSSAAHFSIASIISASSRKTKFLVSLPTVSMVQSSCIDDGLCRLFAAKDNQQIAHHGCLLFFVQFQNIFISQFIQCHFYHANSTVHNFGSS